MYLTYDHKAGAYLFVCSYYEKDTPKSLGFQWNPSKIGGKKSWFTFSVDTAIKALNFADDKTKAHITQELEKRTEKIKESHAETTDKVYLAPNGLKYYPFQNAGIEFLIKHPNTLLADFCGGGKSGQTIGLISNTDIKKVLIMCPNVVKLNWKLECEKWLTKQLTISVIFSKNYVEADIMIINYDLLHKFEKELSSIHWDLVVADEGQYIKSPNVRRSKSAFKIMSNSKRKVFLTGTPILNRPIELWSAIQQLGPDEFGTWYQYVMNFCGGKQTHWGLDTSGASNLELLQSKLRSSFMIRRLKNEVMKELPNITRQIIVLNDEKVVEAEKTLFESAKIEFQEQVDSLKVNSLGFFEILSRIRHETALKKVPKVIDFVEDLLENGLKVILFAHHRDVIKQFKEKWPDSVVIMGETPAEDRQKAIESFQNDPKVHIFIGSIQASGVGITLTASSTVVFAEMSWVPADMTQCESRSARIGQKNAVNVYHLVFDDSIDAHLAKTIVRKQEIADTALDKPIDLKEIFNLGV